MKHLIVLEVSAGDVLVKRRNGGKGCKKLFNGRSQALQIGIAECLGRHHYGNVLDLQLFLNERGMMKKNCCTADTDIDHPDHLDVRH